MNEILISDLTGQTENFSAIDASGLDTGDLRRQYGQAYDKVFSHKPNREPFFNIVSNIAKVNATDIQWKYTEERESWHRRYAYVVAHATTSAVGTVDATLPTNLTVGTTYYFKMSCDYLGEGMVQNVLGNTNNRTNVGAAGTIPKFFLPKQNVKINTSTLYNAGVKDYLIVNIVSVEKVSNTSVILETKVVRAQEDAATNKELTSFADNTTALTDTSSYNISIGTEHLEGKRSYVVGNANGFGSGMPETWVDQPYSTGMAQTQIWKHAIGMPLSYKAVKYRFNPDELGRMWSKLILMHKYEIETDGLFSSLYTDSEGVQHTQGIVDFALQYGNAFSITEGSTSADDFLDDFSQLLDPRYNNESQMMFQANTQKYQWLIKMGGFKANSMELSTAYRANVDFKMLGFRNIFGTKTAYIWTPDGNIMPVQKNIHLDGSKVGIFGWNKQHTQFMPLVGNGENRDTTIYPEVVHVKHTGVDKVVHLIQTEGGFQHRYPEGVVAWT